MRFLAPKYQAARWQKMAFSAIMYAGEERHVTRQNFERYFGE
jgi:hypothetical protein